MTAAAMPPRARLALENSRENPSQPEQMPLAPPAPRSRKGSEIIGPGRALAPADFKPPEVSAGERLIRLAYRTGLSGSTLSNPFRRPARPRLLGVVESPLAGDRARGMALQNGHFLVGGMEVPLEDYGFTASASLPPCFANAIHGFSWLRDLGACPPGPERTRTAERLLTAWLAANWPIGKRPAKGSAWTVENAARRLLAWLVHAPLILSGPEDLRVRTLAAAAETARWLDRNLSRAEDRLAEVSGWCAITAAGLLLPHGKPRRLFGEAGLIRALGELVGEDGGILSRSPLGQIEAIELLVELSACYRAVQRVPPQAADSMLQLLVPPLLALLHGDEGLGNWQGSGATSAEDIAAVVEASGIRTRPLREAGHWGYQRVTARKSVLIFDAAPPPLARHARHGCASTLAFEFSHGSERLIVNCGGAALVGGEVPLGIEQGLRASAAHSTLVLDDANSTAVLGNGKLGGGVGEVEVDRQMLEIERGRLATRIEASHDGYAARYGLIHRRVLTMRDDGTELRGEDSLIPSGRKRRRGEIPFAIRFHIGPRIRVGQPEGGSATLALPDGSTWQLVAEGQDLAIEESLWANGDGRAHPIRQLVIGGAASREAASFSWRLQKNEVVK